MTEPQVKLDIILSQMQSVVHHLTESENERLQKLGRLVEGWKVFIESHEDLLRPEKENKLDEVESTLDVIFQETSSKPSESE